MSNIHTLTRLTAAMAAALAFPAPAIAANTLTAWAQPPAPPLTDGPTSGQFANEHS